EQHAEIGFHRDSSSGRQSKFAGCEGPQGERVYLSLHERGERLVHHPVALDPGLAGEAARYDRELVVTATGFRTGMPGMAGRIVGDLDRLGFERSQALLDLLDGTHGERVRRRAYGARKIAAATAARE